MAAFTGFLIVSSATDAFLNRPVARVKGKSGPGFGPFGGEVQLVKDFDRTATDG